MSSISEIKPSVESRPVADSGESTTDLPKPGVVGTKGATGDSFSAHDRQGSAQRLAGSDLGPSTVPGLGPSPAKVRGIGADLPTGRRNLPVVNEPDVEISMPVSDACKVGRFHRSGKLIVTEYETPIDMIRNASKRRRRDRCEEGVASEVSQLLAGASNTVLATITAPGIHVELTAGDIAAMEPQPELPLTEDQVERMARDHYRSVVYPILMEQMESLGPRFVLWSGREQGMSIGEFDAAGHDIRVSEELITYFRDRSLPKGRSTYRRPEHVAQLIRKEQQFSPEFQEYVVNMVRDGVQAQDIHEASQQGGAADTIPLWLINKWVDAADLPPRSRGPSPSEMENLARLMEEK